MILCIVLGTAVKIIFESQCQQAQTVPLLLEERKGKRHRAALSMYADQTENRNTADLTFDSLKNQKTLAIKSWLKNSLGQRKGTNGVKITG